MTYEGTKKFVCSRCGQQSKRHDNISGIGICRVCDTFYVAEETAEARRLVEENKEIPQRLMWVFESKQLVLNDL